jgi:hypothetical protein
MSAEGLGFDPLLLHPIIFFYGQDARSTYSKIEKKWCAKTSAASGRRADGGKDACCFGSSSVMSVLAEACFRSRFPVPSSKLQDCFVSSRQGLSVPFDHSTSRRMSLQNMRLSESKCDSNTEDES